MWETQECGIEYFDFGLSLFIWLSAFLTLCCKYLLVFCAFYSGRLISDIEFVQKFILPVFQVKNFTPSISPNFNSFSGKKHKKWVKKEKFTPLAKILHCRRQWGHGRIPPLPDFGGNLSEKVIESWYISHLLIIGKIIVIDFTLP